MPQTSTIILGNGKLPLEELSDEIGFGNERKPFDFQFVYRGIPLGAHISAGEAPILEISGEVGPLPFTAESGEARRHLMAVVEAANAALGNPFRVAGGQISVDIAMPLSWPLAAVGVVTSVSLLLVRLKPYLECIEIFLRPPVERQQTGGAALRPEFRRSAGPATPANKGTGAARKPGGRR